MAVRAHRGGVVRYGEPSMVESSACPGSRGVAGLTCGGETRCHVIGIRRSLIVRLVTGIAVRGRTCELASYMATGAGNIHVRTR